MNWLENFLKFHEHCHLLSQHNAYNRSTEGNVSRPRKSKHSSSSRHTSTTKWSENDLSKTNTRSSHEYSREKDVKHVYDAKYKHIEDEQAKHFQRLEAERIERERAESERARQEQLQREQQEQKEREEREQKEKEQRERQTAKSRFLTLLDGDLASLRTELELYPLEFRMELVRQVSTNGDTPLHICARNGFTSTARILIEVRAPLRAIPSLKRSPTCRMERRSI